MTSKTAKHALLMGLVGTLGFATAFAGPRQGDCDVVSLAGSGTRLENGAIVGSSTLTIVSTGEQTTVDFTAVPLGVTDFEEGRVTFVSSHDFVGASPRKVQFTTFDKVTTVPLGEDPSCIKQACGLVFTLVLEKGVGDYTCGRIVSGYDPTLTTFTSTLQGSTLDLNSAGKLCKCSLSGNK